VEDKVWIDLKVMVMDEAKVDESIKRQDVRCSPSGCHLTNTNLVLSQASPGAFAISFLFINFYHFYAALGSRSWMIKPLLHNFLELLIIILDTWFEKLVVLSMLID
jgi:hypothetical protein